MGPLLDDVQRWRSELSRERSREAVLALLMLTFIAKPDRELRRHERSASDSA